MYAQPQMPRKPYFMRNFQRKEMTKMDETKKKFALWAYPSTMEKVERLYQLDNCRSRSEFIEKAVLAVNETFGTDIKSEDFTKIMNDIRAKEEV